MTTTLSKYNSGMFEASFALAENIKMASLDIFNDMAIEKGQIENYRSMLMFEINKLKTLVNDKAEITFDYDEDTKIRASIYDYSEGLIESFKQSLDDYDKKANNSTSLKELKKVYDEVVNEMAGSFMNIWNWSTKNLENAYARKDIAATLVETLEEQNFKMVEQGYRGKRDTNDLYIKFRNNFTGEEILIIVKPEDKEKRVDTAFEIHQLNENADPNRQEEIRLDILRGVRKYYNTNNIQVSPCLANSIGKASSQKAVNIEKIKNEVQKRTPKI